MDGFDVDRFDNNKFNINSNPDKNKYSTGETFLESLYEYMLNAGVNGKEFEKIHRFITTEEYDSDALIEDMEQESGQDTKALTSNCKQYLESDDHYNLIRKHMKNTELSSHSFSIGYIFYYWNFYRYKNVNRDKQSYKNKNDHSGYQPHELFVHIKYQSLKYEILHNKIYQATIDQFNISTHKVSQYIETNVVKGMKSDSSAERIHHYGIKPQTPLSFTNILSIMLYCDWTKLCTKFSSTFRKSKPYESILSVKLKNREYAIWSKTLRETIEYFGQKGYDDIKSEKWNNKHHRIKGPFFCGMSFVMIMPEYSIRLCGPTSTSKQRAVAARFGGKSGMIVQLNNNGYGESKKLRSINCSWLSNFGGEDEQLFMGGYYRIKLETIVNITTYENFYIFFKPLFYFDCMINGTDIGKDNKPKITKQHQSILEQLIHHKLRVSSNEFQPYINDTFEAFTNHKQELIFNLDHIQQFFSEIHGLLMYPLSISRKNTNDTDLKQQRNKYSSDKMQNLFKDITLKLFTNVTHIVLYTSDKKGRNQYPLSEEGLLYLSNLLDLDRLEIIINATHEYKGIPGEKDFMHVDCSWIWKVWNKSSTMIKRSFINKHYAVKCIQTNDGTKWRLKQDSLKMYQLK